MTKQIYIGNLPFQTTEAEVRRLCSPFGTVKSVSMIRDHDSGRFRGYCFVELEADAAAAAISTLNGQEVGGRKIKVNKARPPKKGGGGQKGRSKKGGNRKGSAQKGRGEKEEQPLHERMQRGGYWADEQRFPDSGGRRGGQSRRNQGNGNSEFPHSGGNTRR